MSNIITHAEAEDAARYYPSSRLWWKNRLALGSDQELCWIKYQPDSVYEMHSHPYEQVSVIIQGRLRLTVGEETREVGPGDMWFVPANVPHGGVILGDEAVIFIDVYTPPSIGNGSDVTYYD